jgi:hypothetical protein
MAKANSTGHRQKVSPHAIQYEAPALSGVSGSVALPQPHMEANQCVRVYS